MNGTAIFSDCGRYRYWLTREELSRRGPIVAFVMLNPSTADADALDPTVRRCVGYAREWGASKLIVTNIFALRSTDPRALYTDPAPVGPENEGYIRRAATEAHVVVCAWGNHGALHRQGEIAYRWLTLAGAQPRALKVTQDGHPAHPLYLRADLPPVYFAGPRTSA